MTTAHARTIPAHDAFTPDQVARIFWSHLIEPADYYVGELIAVHGAEKALALAMDLDLAGNGPALLALRGRMKPLDLDALGVIAATLQTIIDKGHTVLTPSDAAWPTRLNDLGTEAPYVLYIDGNARALTTGTEHTALCGGYLSTAYGDVATMQITAELVERGHTIYSSGLTGISDAAHRSALASRGSIVSVLNRGLCYGLSPEHELMCGRIRESGALVTEYPPLASPTRGLRRSQLLAALSNSTIVIEGVTGSDRMSAAHYAGSLGRPVGAMPGPTSSTQSSGPHELIREHGATLVTCAEHVHELTNP